MTDTLLVLIGDTTAGFVTRSQAGRLRFTYDDAYQVASGATPLSVSMPIQIRSHPDQVITPWLWNLLPDDDAVVRRWARRFQVSSTPFSLLATYIGLDCAGAVRFVLPERLTEATSRPGEVTWLTEDEVAERLRDLHADSTAWLGRSFTGQFSLAGAQAKTALLYQNGRWGLPYGAAATTHILKPAVVGLDDHDLNEHLCLDAARRAGLIAARTRVARFGDQTAIVVERYDRLKIHDQVIRVHQEDLCQALSIPPTRKYQNDGGPNPKEIVGLLRRVVSPLNTDNAVARFFDALAWNWLIGGTDAHAKNYSLLLAGGEVRLAPIYDVASALPYGMHERKLKFAMKIGGHYDVVPYPGSWARAADEMGMAGELAHDRIRELAALAPDAFAASAADADVVALKSALPGRLVDIIADRAARCIKLMDLSGGQRR